jgi:hypothetical protein
MSRTEEFGLIRLGSIASGERLKNVETSVLRGIVADNRQPVHPVDPAGSVGVPAAPRVTTGNDGAGWQQTPSIENWKPDGLAIMDRMMDQQDALDRAERARAIAKLGGMG